MTTAASAYLNMGDLSSYYVSAANPTENNRSQKFAWNLERTSYVKFYQRIEGGGIVDFTLRKWEFWSDPLIQVWKYQTQTKWQPWTEKAYADDYYVEVEYKSGNPVYGYTRFSVNDSLS